MTAEDTRASVDDWPEPPRIAAYAGVVGDFVDLVTPDTEADPVALAAVLLTLYGAAVGRGPEVRVGRTRHGANLFTVLVGPTARAAKGSAMDHPRDVLDGTAAPWVTGLGSGEGLVDALRDPTTATDHQTGAVTVVREGANDKRAVLFEPELARLLRVASRQGSTVTSLLRAAWDGDALAITTRHNPVRATGAHVAAVFHTTPEEVQRELESVDLFNGVANRMLWFACRRSRLMLDIPDFTHGPAWDAMTERMEGLVAAGRNRGRLVLDPYAAEAWRAMVPDLESERPPLMAAVCARVRPQVLRLALVYALLDQSVAIKPAHLDSAAAMWEYAERSARWLFSDALGHAEAERILAALQDSDPTGLTRTQIRDLFARNATEAQLRSGLHMLATQGLARSERRPNAKGTGRPVEVWFAT
jgi:hypothetical protein